MVDQQISRTITSTRPQLHQVLHSWQKRKSGSPHRLIPT